MASLYMEYYITCRASTSDGGDSDHGDGGTNGAEGVVPVQGNEHRKGDMSEGLDDKDWMDLALDINDLEGEEYAGKPLTEEELKGFTCLKYKKLSNKMKYNLLVL